MPAASKSYILFDEDELDFSNYRFAETSKTYLEILLNPCYDYVTDLLPVWLAPNLITFLGFVASVISSLLYLYYQPNFEGVSPSWVLFFGAAATLFYNVCDFIDGKQARRIGASSPLGELFDHGVDAVNTILIFIGIATCARLDKSNCLYLFLSSTFMFFSSHLVIYQTGIRIDNNGWFGVLELTLFIVAVQVLVGVLGQEAFDSLKVLGWLPLKWSYLVVLWIGFIYSLVTTLYYTWLFDKKLEGNLVGKKDLSWKGRIERVIPFYLSHLSYWLIAQSDFTLFSNHTVLCIGVFGLHFSLNTLRLISFHTIKKSFAALQPSLVYMAVLLFNAFHPFCDQYTLFVLVFLLEFVQMLWLCYATVHDFAQRLGVRCFTVGKRAD